MTFVVDASFAASWVFADEQNDLATTLLRNLHLRPGYAPSLFWSEMRNLLVTAERGKRIGPGLAHQSMSRLRRLSILDGGESSDGAVMSLALHHRLTAYDASYLEMAKRRSLPLASTDKALVTAARKEAVGLIQ